MQTYRLIRAEFIKLRYNRSMMSLPAVGVALSVLSTFGNGSINKGKLDKGVITILDANLRLVGLAFLMTLFSALAGAQLVTGPLKNRSFGLAALVCTNRAKLIAAKAAVAGTVGTMFGIIAVAASLAATTVAANRNGIELQLGDRHVTTLCLAIVALNMLAGIWGVAIGGVVQHQLATTIGLVVWTSMLEAALLTFVPTLGRFLPGGAMAAVMSDRSLPSILSPAPGIIVLLLWIGAAYVIGQRRVIRAAL